MKGMIMILSYARTSGTLDARLRMQSGRGMEGDLVWESIPQNPIVAGRQNRGSVKSKEK